MNMDESPFTWRTGRSSANQRSPALRWICRRRSLPCGPATRSKMAAPTRPRKLSTSPLSVPGKIADPRNREEYMLQLAGRATAAAPGQAESSGDR